MRWPRAELDKILDEASKGQAVVFATQSDVPALLLRRALYRRMAQRKLHFEIRVRGEILHVMPIDNFARRIAQ
jgi:hypothetical protein